MDLKRKGKFPGNSRKKKLSSEIGKTDQLQCKEKLPATGLLKIDAISTTQDVADSTGTNLANSTIIWNDSQIQITENSFTAILNAANQTGQLFGNPGSQDNRRHRHRVYTLSSNQIDLPIFSFNKVLVDIRRDLR